MRGPRDVFADFRAALDREDPIDWLQRDLIGKSAVIDGPFGQKPLIYADYVASGRALGIIEDTIRDKVLPYYANSHTETSYCGAFTTELRREARAEIARECHADDRHAVIFSGSGATAGLNRLVHLLGVDKTVAAGEGATVLIGPYEHHSNILPWRESGARVVEIAEGPDGGPDLAHLARELATAEGLTIGAFSAASNVTGIVTDVVAVTRMLKAAGALAVWDYAGGAPYLPIDMTPALDAPIDAIALSPHKFVGGPGASGLLIVRKDAVHTGIPSVPGGGTVRYVSGDAHDYVEDIAEREEGGTPNVLGDVRAALVFIVKQAIGQERIDMRNAALARRGIAAFRGASGLQLLGKTDCPRLPIFSLIVRDAAGMPIDAQMATRLLSDHFGVQARGGCACAGPYGHRLLDIDAKTSEQIRARILAGDDSAKPGFVRVNFSYLLADDELDDIITSLQALPELAAGHDRQLPRTEAVSA